jgi:hypothetical protein
MTFEMDTARAIDFVAWFIGSLTLAWLVVHAFLRVAWTLPVPQGRKHGQSAVHSAAHAVMAVGVLALALVSTSWFGPISHSRRDSIVLAAILALLYTPLLAWVLSLTGYVSDTRHVDFGRASGAALVTLLTLVVWSLFVLEHAPIEHG